MTQRKLIIEPIRRNMLCEMIGCKNKRDYKLQRAKSDAIYLCEECLKEIHKFVKENIYPVPIAENDNVTPSATPDLRNMKKPELDAFAAKYGIEIKGVMSNEERANRIYEALRGETE